MRRNEHSGTQPHRNTRRRRAPAWAVRAAAVAALVAAAAVGRAQEQRDDPVNGIIPFPTHEHTLENGLKVIVMPMPSDGLIAFWSIVRTGSRDEYEPGRSGFAHFFEHMMFRGTEKYPADRYQRILTELGADANAFTTDDLTAYHVSMTAADLEQVLELESDRFRNLAYSVQDFQTEAGAVYGEYRKSRTDPMFTLYEALMATAFREHTYGHTTLGFERDIAAMPTMYDYSRSFFERYYRPDNTVLFFAGDVTHAGVLPLVEKHYAQWQRGYAAPPVPAEPEQREERRIDVAYEGQTLPLLWISYKLGAFDPQDRIRVAADLLAELAFGETSDVYRRLVLDEQVVEFLDADAGLSRDPGLFDITARVKEPAQVGYVQDVVDGTVAAYRAAEPDAARLAALKSRLKYGFLMSLQTPDAAAGLLAEHIGVTGGLDGLRALYAAYETVTPADVKAAAERYLAVERRTVGVLRAQP
jgi:zinc protease